MDDDVVVVNEVVEELRGFIASKNLPVDVTARENQIILAAKTFEKTLTIFCYAQGQFYLKDTVGNHRGGFQTQVTVETARHSPGGHPFPRIEMLDEAKRWLNEQRPDLAAKQSG
jgi:hypothetical protein